MYITNLGTEKVEEFFQKNNDKWITFGELQELQEMQEGSGLKFSLLATLIEIHGRGVIEKKRSDKGTLWRLKTMGSSSGRIPRSPFGDWIEENLSKIVINSSGRITDEELIKGILMYLNNEWLNLSQICRWTELSEKDTVIALSKLIVDLKVETKDIKDVVHYRLKEQSS